MIIYITLNCIIMDAHIRRGYRLKMSLAHSAGGLKTQKKLYIQIAMSVK